MVDHIAGHIADHIAVFDVLLTRQDRKSHNKSKKSERGLDAVLHWYKNYPQVSYARMVNQLMRVFFLRLAMTLVVETFLSRHFQLIDQGMPQWGNWEFIFSCDYQDNRA